MDTVGGGEGETTSEGSIEMYTLKVKVKSLSRVRLFATPWTVAYQAPPSMGFSRQEYWRGVLSLSPSLLVVCLILLETVKVLQSDCIISFSYQLCIESCSVSSLTLGIISLFNSYFTSI